MIAIIDYDGGNYKSVINILKRSKINYILSNKKSEILSCEKIILPGVSNFDYCMKKLKFLELDKILYEAVIVKKKYILGICSGMQLSMYFVRPTRWKKYFNLINSEKDASRTKAIEIFPYFSSQLSKKKDANKADAILISSFYYETYKLEE